MRERFTLRTLSVLACVVAGAVLTAETPPVDVAQLVAFEQAVAADPENLRLAADYRQLTIAAGQFDRAIETLERLAKRKGHGPNILISHALACVDKVPVAGDIRRLYLGRDAVDSLTKAIALRPSVLAYYIRGVVNLYYNTFIFHRIPRGIADLNQALTLVTLETPAVLRARVYTSLGDGYWRLEDKVKAKDTWARGAERFPDDPDRDVANEVSAALYAGTRVDTSLRGVVP
ncbi:MAG: tetratricopeptide repeat protein [Acidobacteria bacterium]|nr:tetratricopeptide repeat protein [Acidobacteriota bacterium]